MRQLMAVCVCVVCAGAASAQDVKVERYALPNGMKVILHEDHSLPLATVNIWYGVGAQDEPPGRSGFAHLFEHLMFMGTKRVAGNQFDVIMEEGGGANNASTDLHRTNYYSWGPSKLLPTLLWLDADRLEDMGLQMTQEKLDKQRDVVRNELRQVVENAPYGKAGEAVYKLLYTPDHPYYYGVIGTHEDLEAANVTNVKDFFANFYVPNNASLVVAGDFDPAQIKPLVGQLFGTLPAGQPIARKYTKPAEAISGKLTGVKRFTAIDRVELPKVQFSYHSPAGFGPGDAEMQLAADVLASGKASRLYKRLVIDEKLATEVSASQQGYPLGGMFQIDVLTKPEADLSRVEKIVDEEIAKFVKDGPSEAELARNIAAAELAALGQLQTLRTRADKLNEYEYYWGEPNSFKRDLDRFRNATSAGVKEWAARTLNPDARVIVNVLPEEPERGASARDTRPGEADAGAFSVPAPTTFELSNKLRVMVWQKRDLPLVAMRLVRATGGALDAPGKQGLGALAIAMMGEGAGDLDALAYENAVQAIGAVTRFQASPDGVSAGMTVVKRNLEKGAELLADAVRRPRFDQKEWDRVRSLALDEVKNRVASAGAIAGVVGDRLLYGDGNPYGAPTEGFEKTLESLTLEEAKAAFAGLMRPEGAVFLIAGDLSPEGARGLAEKMFGGWKASPAAREPASPDYSIPPRSAMAVAIVDRPGATQTMVRFVAPGVKFADSSRVQRRLLNTLLGGSFTSRLNQNLREDKGYTYGARSTFGMGAGAGDFSAAASVQAAVTGAALREFMTEFDRLRAGDVSDAEVQKARETVRDETVRGFESLSGMLNAAEERITIGLPLDSVAADLAEAGLADAKSLNALSRTALPLQNGVLVLVGDKATILEQIKDLGLPEPVMYDAEGNAVR